MTHQFHGTQVSIQCITFTTNTTFRILFQMETEYKPLQNCSLGLLESLAHLLYAFLLKSKLTTRIGRQELGLKNKDLVKIKLIQEEKLRLE